MGIRLVADDDRHLFQVWPLLECPQLGLGGAARPCAGVPPDRRGRSRRTAWLCLAIRRRRFLRRAVTIGSDDGPQAASGTKPFAGRLDLAQDTVLVCSDHGHIDLGGHGGPDAVVTQQPFVLAGAHVRPGVYEDAQMADVAPTLALLLGTNLPAVSQGSARVEPNSRETAPHTSPPTRTARPFARRQESGLCQSWLFSCFACPKLAATCPILPVSNQPRPFCAETGNKLPKTNSQQTNPAAPRRLVRPPRHAGFSVQLFNTSTTHNFLLFALNCVFGGEVLPNRPGQSGPSSPARGWEHHRLPSSRTGPGGPGSRRCPRRHRH